MRVACAGGGSEEDEEAAALEREVEAIRAQDDAPITDRVDRMARDRAKGQAVKNQKALWERMLEMRILLQRCLQVSALLAIGSSPIWTGVRRLCHYNQAEVCRHPCQPA